MKLLQILKEITIKPNSPKIWDFRKYIPNFNPLQMKKGDYVMGLFSEYGMSNETSPKYKIVYFYNNSDFQGIIIETGDQFEFKILININNRKQSIDESINRFVTINEIPNILKQEFPNYTSKIGEYISSINIEPSNYEDLTYNDLIQDFQNYLDNDLNEIQIKQNSKTWDLTANNWGNLSNKTFDQIKIGDYIQTQIKGEKYIIVGKEYDDFIDEDIILYTDENHKNDPESYRFLSRNWFNQDDDLNEITIKPNITYQNVIDYLDFPLYDNYGNYIPSASDDWYYIIRQAKDMFYSGEGSFEDVEDWVMSLNQNELNKFWNKIKNSRLTEITINSNVTKEKIWKLTDKLNLHSDNVIWKWRTLLRKFEDKYFNGERLGYIKVLNELPQKGLDELYKDIKNLVNTQNDLNEITIKPSILNLPPFKNNSYNSGNNFKETVINLVKANPLITEKQITKILSYYSPKYISDNIRKIKELDRVICINHETKRKVYAYKIKK